MESNKMPKELLQLNLIDMLDQEVKEFEKCKESLWYFMTKYITVGGKPFTTQLSENKFNELIYKNNMKNIDKVKKIVLTEHHLFLDQLHSEGEIPEDEFYADMKSSTLLMEEIDSLGGILSFMHFEMGYDEKDTQTSLINLLAYNL